MGNTSKETMSRRGFLRLRFLTGNTDQAKTPAAGGETVKMLTADGKLVEVDKSIADQFTGAPAVSNKDILTWMNNPSKNEE